MNFFAKMNMLVEEARRNRSDRFNPPYSAFPNTYNPCSADDFVSDEMSGYESINYLEFDGFENGSGCKDFGSTRRGRRSQYRGRWAGRGGPIGGYYNPPERGGHPPNHGYHKFPNRHIRGGRRANLKRPNSQESTSKQGPDVPVESGEPGPVGVVQETSPPKKDLNTQFDLKSRRREKNKLKKLRQKERKAAAKAQTGQEAQIQLTAVTSQDVDGATAEKKQIKAELEERKRKRKERPSADDKPKLKIAKTETSGGDKTNTVSKDSTDKMEAERAVILKTASNPEAKGQSSVMHIKELAELKAKLQEKAIPFSDSARHFEETNKDSTSAPVGSNTVEQNSFGAVSSGQASKSTAEGQEQSLEAKTDQAENSSEQQRRRIRNQEKRRISAHRLTFVCLVCKFTSFCKWKLKAHLKSKFHKDHFKFLSEHLPKPTVDFLKTHFSKKQHRVQDCIDQIPDHRATLCQVYEDQDLTLDISMEHFIRKAEAAHCLACDEYIPMQYYHIQLHLQSSDHRANCKGMMGQSKNLGLSTVQRLLRLKCTRQKLELYLKDTGVTKEPKRNHKKVWSTQQRPVPEADMMTQEAESFCGQGIQADDAEEEGKDQEAELLCGQGIQADEAEEDGKDQEAELLCGQGIQADEAEEDRKDQEAELLCGQGIQADEAEEDRKDQEAELLCGQGIQADEAEEDRKDQEAELLCGQGIQADEAEEKWKDQEAELLFERGMQSDEAEEEWQDQEAELLCGQGIQADEAEEEWKDQEAELLCGQVNRATAAVKDRKIQEEEPVCLWMMQADEAVGKKNKVEPCIGQVIQCNEAVGKGKKKEAEPFCGSMMQADKAVENRKAKEVEPLSKGVVPATDPVINGEEHHPEPTCEESIPATENLQEYKQSERTESLCDLLDEEDDLEGVELGEEEMEEDDI